MHIRTTTVKQNGRTYRYAQLVESYRRKEDGMPMKRVVANLGRLNDDEIKNFRVALAASRAGERAVVASVRTAPLKPQANLQYLDVAVLLELWRRCGLDRLCNQLLPGGNTSVRPADVVTALAIHRCVDPGSKLHATRWFPRTALPELLDVPAEDFGNTRLHRVLAQLAEETGAIMRSLPSLYLNAPSAGAFSVLYVDISDATFEGAGPDLARKGRSKRDVICQRIGIVLLCDGRGYPLRWKVIAGNAPEAPELIEQMRLVAGTVWGKQVPIIADRAVGKSAYLQELLAAGVHFVTAMTRSEFPSYAPEIAEGGFEKLDREDVVRRLQERGFERVDDTLLLRDLGIITPNAGLSRPQTKTLDSANPSQDALRRAMNITEAVQTGAATSRNQAAKSLGYHIGTAKAWSKLLKLTADLQDQILSGAAMGLPIRRIIKIASLRPEAQRAAFDQLCAERDAGKLRKRSNKPSAQSTTDNTSPVRVRAVAYFNPEMFEGQRDKARRQLAKVADFVKDLNTKAAGSSRTQTGLAAAVDRMLRPLHLLKAYDVRIHQAEVDGRRVNQVELHLCKADWKRRRALDGFSVLVTHPDVALSPEELCARYRGKDAVEKDFQTIKSVLSMLPVRHRTDNKVLAHVTICVLALLLERLLRDELKGTTSAEEALETLATCDLNRYGDTPASRAYLVTQPDDAQQKILRTLKLNQLADDDQMIEAIHPK